MPIPSLTETPAAIETITVGIGHLVGAAAPTRLRALLGSCVGLVLYDRVNKLGGLAHVVLPTSRGVLDTPGKYADTAVPALIAEIERRGGRSARGRLIAKLIGGACMFQIQATQNSHPGLNVGQQNHEALDRILTALAIPIVARDVGGATGRRLTLDTATGAVTIKAPGGQDYEI